MSYELGVAQKDTTRELDGKPVRIAPSGMFRLVGVDPVDASSWVEEDLNAFPEAREYADKRAKDTDVLVIHIYNDTGNHCYRTS